MFKKIIVFIISITLPNYVIATSSNYYLDSIIDEQTFYIYQMQDFLKIYKNGDYIQKSFDELKKNFKSKEDREYMQKVMATGKKPTKLVVQPKDKKIEISVTGFETILISDFDSVNKTMNVNGKLFKVSPEQSLEDINKKLSLYLTPEKQANIFNFIIPDAYAWGTVALIAGLFVSLFIVLPIWSQLSAIDTAIKSIENILNACENRDESVPFEESETSKLIQKMIAKISNIKKAEPPELNTDTVCSSWAAQAVRVAISENIYLSTDKAVEWCFAHKKANRCIEDYRAGRPKKRPSKSSKSDQSTN